MTGEYRLADCELCEGERTVVVDIDYVKRTYDEACKECPYEEHYRLLRITGSWVVNRVVTLHVWQNDVEADDDE